MTPARRRREDGVSATPYPRTNQTMVDAEISAYGDVVQGSFLDAYKNLTLKHVMGLQWASDACPGASYVIKMDDDIAVDFYQLKSLALAASRQLEGEQLFGGLLQVNLDVVRDTSSKWFVAASTYADKTYPNFLSGWAYVASMGVVRRVLSISN